MPPTNRHQPRRAQSSTSEYTLTQFQREFPDDAACLEHAYCPKCGSDRPLRRGTAEQGRRDNRREPGGMFMAMVETTARAGR